MTEQESNLAARDTRLRRREKILWMAYIVLAPTYNYPDMGCRGARSRDDCLAIFGDPTLSPVARGPILTRI